MTHWCAELDLFGLVKSGYPGFLCFEGPQDGVRDMIRRIKALQWHAITVKTEVPYVCHLPAHTPAAEAQAAALSKCCLARGHTSMLARSAAAGGGGGGSPKLRTSMDEVETSRELVERCVDAGSVCCEPSSLSFSAREKLTLHLAPFPCCCWCCFVFSASLRAAGIPEDEIKFALNLRS